MSKKFKISTLGCKLNFSESSSFARELIAAGYEESHDGEGVDLIMVNTCAVTLQAEKKCRQTLKQLIKLSPKAKVMVTGCFSQLSASRLANIDGVDMVFGNEEKLSMIDFVEGDKLDEPLIKVSAYKDIASFKPGYSSEGRTRCFLKVQDGCDYFCSYCTIPLARGKSRSASIKDTIEVAYQALSSGVKEIILTGVNIGTFGKGTEEDFYDLLLALEAMDGDFRVRLGSVEPELLKPEIIELVARSERFAPHFHLPLQSASNDVLLLMRRHYTRELFAQRVAKIKELMPLAFIGVDVIVGMNGETDEMFEEAYQFIETLPFSQLHVFTYSERPNTRALEFVPKIAPLVKKERSHRLITLSEKRHQQFCEENIGETLHVLFEDKKHSDEMFGYSENYVRVKAPYDESLIGNITELNFSPQHIIK